MYRIRSECGVRVAIANNCDGLEHNPYFPPSVTLCVAALIALWTTPHTFGVPTFTNVTLSAGINHVQSSTPGVEGMTGGAAAADFDGDGLVDLYFTRVDAPDVLYRNTGSGFDDVSAEAGFTQSLPTSGAAFADIDNDG